MMALNWEAVGGAHEWADALFIDDENNLYVEGTIDYPKGALEKPSMPVLYAKFEENADLIFAKT